MCLLLLSMRGLCRRADLSDPIDVYSEWIDSCESINKKVAEHRQGGGDEEEEEEELGAGDAED